MVSVLFLQKFLYTKDLVLEVVVSIAFYLTLKYGRVILVGTHYLCVSTDFALRKREN